MYRLLQPTTDLHNFAVKENKTNKQKTKIRK